MWRWVTRRTAEFIENVKNPLHFPSERTLFHFQNEESLKHWRVFSDLEYGGASEAALNFINEHPSFAIFCGHSSTDLPGSGTRLKKSGFCGIHSKVLKDLSDFSHLRYRVRGKSSQDFIASLQTDSWIVGGQSYDLWQAVLPCRSEDWHDVDIPIHEFLLSWRGRLVEHRIEMNTGRIKGLGISFSGRNLPGGSTDFSIDLARITSYRQM